MLNLFKNTAPKPKNEKKKSYAMIQILCRTIQYDEICDICKVMVGIVGRETWEKLETCQKNINCISKSVQTNDVKKIVITGACKRYYTNPCEIEIDSNNIKLIRMEATDQEIQLIKDLNIFNENIQNIMEKYVDYMIEYTNDKMEFVD